MAPGPGDASPRENSDFPQMDVIVDRSDHDVDQRKDDLDSPHAASEKHSWVTPVIDDEFPFTCPCLCVTTGAHSFASTDAVASSNPFTSLLRCDPVQEDEETFFSQEDVDQRHSIDHPSRIKDGNGGRQQEGDPSDPGGRNDEDRSSAHTEQRAAGHQKGIEEDEANNERIQVVRWLQENRLQTL